jgi:hypothetical protein
MNHAVFWLTLTSLRNLATADAILAIGKEPQSSEPLIETDCGILADTPNLHGKLTLGMMAGALPNATGWIEFYAVRAASWTGHNAIRPAPDCEIVDAVIGIRKVDDCFLKALRFLAHNASHYENHNSKVWMSQVNNCPL